MSISVEFQKRVNDLIDEKDLLKSDLPKEIGISYNSFSNAVNYGIVPKPKILMKIADYFNISIEYLLVRTNDENFYKAEKSESFQVRLETLRESKKQTYYEISKIIHIEESYFSKWKSNNYLPSLEFLILLSEYFKVSIDYLLGRTDEK